LIPETWLEIALSFIAHVV